MDTYSIHAPSRCVRYRGRHVRRRHVCGQGGGTRSPQLRVSPPGRLVSRGPRAPRVHARAYVRGMNRTTARHYVRWLGRYYSSTYLLLANLFVVLRAMPALILASSQPICSLQTYL